ncbi:MAG: bifunctional phosphoribosylaminoimidazolecarboxamide formyltransferase/IMP cyclohydrolase [Pseudomonadota bacterium]
MSAAEAAGERVRPIRRALLSVSDKSGLVDFARSLHGAGIALVSTGGTFRALREAGLPAQEVAELTGYPEMMDGRVKTLHPRVHGAILGRRDQDQQVMIEHGIEPIDLVVVNLYPFAATVARADATLDDAIENIDIGGPAMVRAAAKNHPDVLVIVDPSDYPTLTEMISDTGGMETDLRLRRHMARKAYAHTAAYDAMICRYLGGREEFTDADSTYPEELALGYRRRQALRYGENPHQSASFYVVEPVQPGTLASAEVHQGKALSFNNLNDTDAALACVQAFTEPACVIVKHANPCGVALSERQLDAYDRAYRTDPTSAFGGIIAFNRTLETETLKTLLERQFAEVIVAPALGDGVLEVAKSKKNLRLLTVGERPAEQPRSFDLKRINGGLLLQDADQLPFDPTALRTVSQRAPSEQERADLLFAWTVAWFVKSNAIVYARERQTVGVGAGQMSRVVSAQIAGLKAEAEGLTVPGSVMASDAFFPFRDGIDAAAERGVTAVIQPGGSVRDEEVIAAADEHGMAMLFTGTRHFRH